MITALVSGLVGIHLIGTGGMFVYTFITDRATATMGGVFGWPSRKTPAWRLAAEALVWEVPIALYLIEKNRSK